MKNSFSLIGTAIWSLMLHTGFRFSRRALFIGGIVFIFMTQSLMAAATIRGRVFDRDTEDALPGANVIIKGTSIGAAANLDGEYFIPNVPFGRYTIMVSYIGYGSMSVEVTVPVSGRVAQNFGLQPVVLEGKEVVVTAQAQGQMQAINQQLAANKIANIVSEARIQELPDFNAAQALSRLPGVSTLESSGIMEKQYVMLCTSLGKNKSKKIPPCQNQGRQSP